MSDACARCSQMLGRSCCEVSGDEPLATLTHADISRIERVTGERRNAFVDEEVLGLEEALAYEQRRPAYRGYFRAGPTRLTLRKAEDACVFFEPGRGCRLSVSVRPTACRLYPFEPNASAGFTLAVDRFPSVVEARASGESACLAVQEADGWPALKRAFGWDAEGAALELLGERLRDEVRAHGGSPDRRQR